MGLFKKKIIKAYLQTKYEMEETKKITTNIAYIEDWDILFNGVFQMIIVGGDGIWQLMHSKFIESMKQLLNERCVDGVVIEEVVFFLSYKEMQSGYIQHKKRTTDERTKDGLSEEEIARRGPVDTWKTINAEDDTCVRHTPAYKVWKFEQQFEAFQKQIVDDLKKGATKAMGIHTIHFVGFKGNHYEHTENGTQIYPMTGSGEADVHFYNMRGFAALHKRYCVVLKSTDTDCFVISSVFPVEWTFEHGFYINNGVYQKTPEKTLWLDMKKARDDRAVNWQLFGFCCILMGTDYVEHIISPVRTVDIFMADIRFEREQMCKRMTLLEYVQYKINRMPKPNIKKSIDKAPKRIPKVKPTPVASDVIWNCVHWNVKYS